MARERSPALRLTAAALLSPPIAVVISGFAFFGDAILLPHLTFAALLVCYLAMLLFGLPAHAILMLCNWRGPLFYIGVGSTVGLATVFASSVLIDPAIGDTIAQVAMAGAACGGAFWLIRRPDRDQPPASSSNKTSA